MFFFGLSVGEDKILCCIIIKKLGITGKMPVPQFINFVVFLTPKKLGTGILPVPQSINFISCGVGILPAPKKQYICAGLLIN
jgi:hypothetical protein